jgi:hypothetical protein
MTPKPNTIPITNATTNAKPKSNKTKNKEPNPPNQVATKTKPLTHAQKPRHKAPPPTKPPTKPLPKGANPCYHVNPHKNKNNKLKSKKFNISLYDRLAKINKNPKSKIEKTLYKIRDRFQKKYNISKTPSPHKSKFVIYCIYNNNPKLNKLYIGKTIYTAYVRLQQHIHTYNKTPLHRYMQNNNPKSFKTFVLQTTTHENLDNAEYFWIRKLQTQRNNTHPDNLNCEPQISTSRTLQHKLQYHNITTKNNITNNKIKHYFNDKNRIYASRNYARRIIYLNNQNNKQTYLNSLHPKTLRHILSTLTNKQIQPIIPRRLTKPTIYLQHTKPPTSNITKQNSIINTLLSHTQINELIHETTQALHNKIMPYTKKLKFLIPIPITFITSHLNRRTITALFKEATTFLPTIIKDKIDSSIIYKNLRPSYTIFNNYKETASQNISHPTTTPNCICHHPSFKPYLNPHNHIDTNDSTLLNHLETLLNLPHTNIQELADKGANYITKPYIDTKLINKFFQKDIQKFIQKISCTYNLPDFIFLEWKDFLINTFQHITKDFKPQTDPIYNLTNIKNSLKHIHQHITISPTDKMKNNYRYTCTTYYQRLIFQKITAKPTLLQNPNINPQATLEKGKTPAYTLLNQTPTQIINAHTKFLTQYQLNADNDKLPYLYIIHKAHKFGNRGVTAAFNVTTSKLAKSLHTILRLIIKELQKEDNTFTQLHNINRHWRIDNANDVNYLLHKHNTSSLSPSTVQSFDIEGFYDNIDIPEMENIINKLIPHAFSLAKKKYITVNPSSNKAYWTNYKKADKYKHNNTYTFTHTDIINLQIWHLNNAHITFNKKIYKQIKGIGQGTNQSPDLADLILMYYERNFINYHTLHNPQLALQFNYSARKMDDILFINNPNAHKHIYQDEENPHGIYPRKFFTLTTDQPPSDSTNYLDMHIHTKPTPNNLKNPPKFEQMSLTELRKLAKRHKISSRDNKPILIQNLLQKFKIKNKPTFHKPTIWNTKTYNKTDKFPIQAINFPHYTSHTTQSILTGSIIGRLHAYTITNSYYLTDYLQTTKKLFHKLITQNQYPKYLITQATKTFTKRHRTNYPITPQGLYNLLIKSMGSI